MAPHELRRLIPDAPPSLLKILDGRRGPVQPPIRSEIFGLQRFAQHGRSLGATHRAARARAREATFFPRLRSNIRTLREAHHYIGLQASTGYDISPAAEWLLDNFHLIEAQLKQIHEGLPRSYFRALPMLLDEPLAGLPRVYGIAWAFVAHTDGAFDEALLIQFLNAYQETRELNLSEAWALPTTLRVVLIENLRRLAERVACNKAAREAANLCCDRIDECTVEDLDALLAELDLRGVGRVFLAQMAQRRRDGRHTAIGRHADHLDEWLHQALPDLAAAQAQQITDQASDNLSVSNAVGSLRAIGDADWSDIVARSGALMRLMLGSPVFKAEHATTRDQTLHGIERLAKRSGRSELSVGHTLLDLLHAADPDDAAAAVTSHWLSGAGRPALLRALGMQERAALFGRGAMRHLALPLYLGSLVLGTLLVVAWLLSHHSAGLTGALREWWWALPVALVSLFPASEAVVAVINRLISESMRPRHLPRLALADGIPPEHRVMVVIPAMLTDRVSTQQLVHRLQLHHLANPERHAQFALLSDWADADSATTDSDDTLLADAVAQIHALNVRHRDASTASEPRFIVLHRARRFSPSEQRWIGWERKRGKLEQLIAALVGSAPAAFIDLGDVSRIAADTRYIVTLDSDTQLPPGCLRALVGVAAHPQNQPVLDATARRVVAGYGILQPRILTPLPTPRSFTLYHWLFAGRCGIDPYSAATSEIYQDLFGEGSYSGKGLLHVGAMHAVLAGRLPEGQVLSHDLLEGSIARCAAVTDITVIEDAPFHADVAASRVHRWTRGDWQLLPMLRLPLRAVNRWKMFDNLRRSLVAPMSLALLLLAVAGSAWSPWVALVVVLAAFTGGPLMGAVAALVPGRSDLAKLHFFRQAGIDLARALWGGLWSLAQLTQLASMALDAIGRAIWRMTVSHRHLLQWTTAAAAQAHAQATLAGLLQRHRAQPVLALALLAVLFAAGTAHPVWAVVLCMLWAAAPLSTWWVSRVRPVRADAALPLRDQAYLHGIARDTWRLFERCVGTQDNHLPPDNLQTAPHDMVAHRTSPTNIGLYLLSVACARQFGWIGTQELLARLEATLGTLGTLQTHRGHFLNWYDTQTRAPLLPMYVSTVDSGNLSGHLLAVAQACRALASAPHDDAASRRAIQLSTQRLRALQAHTSDRVPAHGAMSRLLALADPLSAGRDDAGAFEQLLREADDELRAQHGTADRTATTPAGTADRLRWCLSDHVAMLRSAGQDARAAAACEPLRRDARDAPAQRLLALARNCEQLAWQPEFGFLYHRKRHLFHIGYRVAEQELDAGFYDLLASESRLTSLLAIAKGDVPVSHWGSLGRLFFAVGARAGLRSWSGSMFEYLMPGLVLDEPHGSVLRDASRAAIDEQCAFARAQHVPWGISESAYAGSDHTLAYQYAPQGVPRLALRRTPIDELVVAPYATALAAQIGPHLACSNFAALEALVPRGQYGFIEALDFSPARQVVADGFTPVFTYMAHHQGMTIVALANVLLDGVAQRWGMADPHIEAVSSLLHERAPRAVSTLYEPSPGPPPQALQRRAPGLLREVMPGSTALEPTHVLSNGRYSVSLRANGAGTSRWGTVGITRWRDDALRDAHGSFFYLRWDQQPRPVSITQHPAPDPAAHYKSLFHADRVCFDAAWTDVQAHTTVWVSPEDDIEFRQVELRNLSERTLDIELMSAFELTLADARADEAHPAFSNLFVSARWQAEQQALLFERKPRLANERGMHVAHFVTGAESQVLDVRVQANRQHWQGRNRSASAPLASFQAPPTAPEGAAAAPSLETGLDPVCALAVRLRIAPNARAQLTFATAAADTGTALHTMVDKYRQPSHVQRSSLMSATLTGIRLRALRISAENLAAVQTLTTALLLCLTRPQGNSIVAEGEAPDVCDRRLLWRFGISGDRPLVLVSAGVTQSLGLLRSLAQALRWWSWGGVACDLVVVTTEVVSYQMPLQRETAVLRDRHMAEVASLPGPVTTGFHLLRAADLSVDELSTLRSLARLRLQADGRPLLHHLQEWAELHEEAFAARHDTSTEAVAVGGADLLAERAPAGEFAARSGEYRFEIGAGVRAQRPWINVLSNPAFGAQISEAGGGYTWAVNSRLNQLTAWSNDPVADPPSEWFLVQDRRTRQVWSVTPSAWGDDGVVHRVSHGQGYSVVSHRRGDVEVTASWCVDMQTAVKQVRVRLVNRGQRTQQLRVIGMVEWMMGANRADRSTVHTTLVRQRLSASHAEVNGSDSPPAQKLTALLCTQRDRTAGFGGGTAFLGLAAADDESEDWTCDRREWFDARGALVLPDHLGQRSGAGLDPCAALSASLSLAAGETAERVFLLGYGESPLAARDVAIKAAVVPPARRIEQVRAAWDTLLGATTVQTPDPLLDMLVNRWLLYQTVSCRIWAKAGFYQAGGATGFRDQLQDTMALAWAAPAMLREQIVLSASRQFAEGDVQHWWHAPTGAGVRTHFSDDLLWLPHACVHYLRATGDGALLEQQVPFIEGVTIPEGAEDAYDTPRQSALSASIYEHAARTLDCSLRVGAHGLPLMGSGDWNDGMNRVGHLGRGESVWLAWFLCRLVPDFAPLARERGDTARASRWEQAARKWREALQDAAWDGQWFKRAFFDDGTALGSRHNTEARIDLIAQAWSVLSDAAPQGLQRMALAAADDHLVDHDAGLIRLLDPPLAVAQPSAGYIQAYPPGVRENGGQYSHAGVWALMAQAEMATRRSDRDFGPEPAAGDLAYRYFTYLSPAHRARHPTWGGAYAIEPYVMAGDVYTQQPYTGRGGWSWYTGAAAWMHRAAVESLFGLRLGATQLSFRPCLPSHWPRAELTLRRGERVLRFVLIRAPASEALLATAPLGAQLLHPAQELQWTELPDHSCHVIPLGSPSGAAFVDVGAPADMQI